MTDVTVSISSGLSASFSVGSSSGVGGSLIAPSALIGTGQVGTATTNNFINLGSIWSVTTVAGSTTVNAFHVNHGASVGDDIDISNMTFGDGVYTELAAQLNGVFTITEVVSTAQYRFVLPSAAVESVVTSGAADVDYEINVGKDFVIGGPGWGAGSWGRGTWGSESDRSTFTDLALWSEDNFGQDLIINIRDGNIYYWKRSQGTGVRAQPLSFYSTNAPTVARKVIVSDRDRHVILFGANPEGSTEQDPMLIRFSDQENPFEWRARPDTTAGDLRLGNGSEIVTAVETKREVIVLTDTSIHSMSYIGAPYTFGINQIGNNITTRSPNCAVAVGDAVYWMGYDRFYMYDGRIMPLPCTVRDYVFQDFNEIQAQKVTAGINASFNEVIWFYPSETNSSANGGTDENDRYVIFNYEESIWYYGQLERTAWADRGIIPDPVATTSSSNVSEPSYLFRQEQGYDANGSPITAYIDSSPVDMEDGEKFVFINRMIPDVDFSKSDSTAVKEATFTLKSQRYPGTGFTTSKPYTVTDTTGQTNTRIRGRSFGLRVESDNQGVFWRLGSPRVDVRQDGKR